MEGPRDPTRRLRPLRVLMALAAMSACGGESTHPVGVDAYIAVIDEFLPPPNDDGTLPVIYVARLGGEPFPLDDQVAMIAAVETTHDLRFVDDVGAAVDDGHFDAPPRDDGLLLGVGTITAATPHTVRVEIYSDAGRIDARRLTLSLRGERWRVDTSETVDPEGLLSGD